MANRPTITLVGCGKMGGAMVRGWVAAGITDAIYVIEPSGLPADLQNLAGVQAAETVPDCDMAVLAVKPQVMNEVCHSLNPGRAAVLSIAAGQKIANFEKHFGTAHPIIRAMPNTPAAIGKGMSVAVANKNVSPESRAIAGSLLSAIGKIAWVEDEALMDAVTALSGSGPAYVFYLIEVLTKAGEECGLAPDFAATLARQTVIGSAALAESDAQTQAATLRKNVTSPGGTTEAALNVLMDGRMQSLFTEGLRAATARSRELSK